MNKKYLALFLIIIALPISKLGAQGLYIEAYGGYTLDPTPMKSSQVKEELEKPEYILETVNIRYGQGLVSGISVGYLFNKKAAVEFTTEYHLGVKSYENKALTSYQAIGTVSSLMWVLRQEYTDVAFYAKMGASFGLISMKFSDRLNIDSIPEYQYIQAEIKESGGIAFGVQTAMGMEVELTKKISLIGEIMFRVLSYSPHTREVVGYNDENGVDRMYILSESDRKIQYKDEVQMYVNIPKAGERLKVTYPINSLGARIGMRYQF